MVAVLTKGQVCDLLIAGTAVTNVAAGMDMFVVCGVGSCLYDELIVCSEEFYRVCV
jgi:hypothetical protein